MNSAIQNSIFDTPPPELTYTDLLDSGIPIARFRDATGIKNAADWKKKGIPKKFQLVIRSLIEAKQKKTNITQAIYSLSRSEGGYKNTTLSNWNTDFYGLVQTFSTPAIGNKDGSYFIRSVGTKRNNTDTSDKAYVLIMDGDSHINEDGEIVSGAPKPILVHEVLKRLGIQHLIYTSYSNDIGLPKYRVVIPCEYSPEQLPILLDYLFKLLHEAGVMLTPVPENRVWSQPWYYSRVPDEQHKSLFEFYQHDGALLDAAGICQQWQLSQPEPVTLKPIITPPTIKQVTGQRDPIAEFNQTYRPSDILKRNHYIEKNGRFLRPDSSSKIPAVQYCLDCTDGVERVYSHGGDVLNDGYAHNAFDCYRLLECGGDFKTALAWNPELAKHNQRLYRQEQEKLTQAQPSEAKPLPPVTEPHSELTNQPLSLLKQNTINQLLDKVVTVNFWAVCLELGWQPVKNQDGTEKPPLQKHYKVAIIDQLLQVAHANNWHLVRDSGMNYLYTGCMWLSLDKDEFKNLLKDVAIKQSYSEIEARDAKFINSLYEQALQDGFFADKHFVRQSMINLNNCTLVLNSEGVTIKEFDYRDFLTHQLPFNYDSTARNLILEKYLDDVLPDKDTQRTLQEVCGYLFIKGMKLEKIFFLYGTGANGKSVLFEVINGLIGTENISHFSLESLTDETGYFRAKIKDKIVNYGTDIKLTKIDAGMFKTLASGEPIEARLPYGEPFTMSDYAKMIFNVNRLDNANIEHTYGFYRRILIIPFEKTIADEDQDRSLHKKILSNKAGVLNWIIAGAERVIRTEDIFVSAECQKFKAKFIKETDSAAMFLEARRYNNQGQAPLYLSSLYADYKGFCLEDGYKSLGKNNFSKRLEALGYERAKDHHNKDCFNVGSY